MNDIHPVKSPITADWTAMIMFVMLVGIGLLILWWVVRRRKQKAVEVIPKEPKITKETMVEKTLRQLTEAERLISEARWSEYYLQASEIFKGYLSWKFDRSMGEMTSREIMRVVGKDDGLNNVLRIMDGAMFAGEGENEARARQVFINIKEYVAR